MTDKTRNSRSGAKKPKKPFRLDLFIVDNFLPLVCVLAFVVYMVFKVEYMIYVSSVGILLILATLFSKLYFKLQQYFRSKILCKIAPVRSDFVPDLPDEMVKVLNEVARQQSDQQ